MDRDTEIELTKELLALRSRKSAYLVESVSSSPVEIYLDPERFRQERNVIMRKTPQPAVHASELPAPGSFLRRSVAGLPVLFTRDADGAPHAFLNVCRHRGSRLVEEQSGCQHRFTCPYHAWTFSNRGELIGVPHEKQGFPNLDRRSMGLKRLGCAERHGWIWVSADSDEAPDVDAGLQGLAADVEALGAADYRLVHTDELTCPANWKLLVEGGIEAYHFRVAHRDTIGPYFSDNLSTYQGFGPHMRSILAKRSLAELETQPEDAWRLLDHAQVLLSVFPLNQFLIQSDHFVWIRMEPLSESSTHIRLSTLAPAGRLEDATDIAHWSKNHAITLETLIEDFDIAAGIQSGLASGANSHLTFGRFEGALAAFNESVERCLEGRSANTTDTQA